MCGGGGGRLRVTGGGGGKVGDGAGEVVGVKLFFDLFRLRLNMFVRVINLQNVSKCFKSLTSCKQFSAEKN